MSEIVRAYREPVEAQAIKRGDTSTRRIRGVASVTYDGTPGTEYALDGTGSVVERISPGAFDHLLGDDCIACIDHDGRMIVGRNGQNLKLWTSSRGLEYEITLPDTSIARDLWENVQAGIIRGSSFKAKLKWDSKDAVEWSRSGKLDVLTIKKFEALRDIACVSDPAYRATDVQAVQRSLEAHRMSEETIKRILRAENLRS